MREAQCRSGWKPERWGVLQYELPRCSLKLLIQMHRSFARPTAERDDSLPTEALVTFFILPPEPVPGAMDKDIFQSRLTDGNRFDLSRECLDHVRDETMSLLAFQPNFSLKH